MAYYEEVKFDASNDLVTYLAPWIDKISGLDVFATPKLLSQYLPNLESLKVIVFPENKQMTEDMIRMYADGLKHLDVELSMWLFHIFVDGDAAVPTLPLLQSLRTDTISPGMLDIGRHVTKLILGRCVRKMPRGTMMSPEYFKFPNLKELVMGSNCEATHLLIQCNAEHLETLIFCHNPVDRDGERWMEKLKDDLVLPKLKNYIHYDIDSPVIPEILKASCMSLERLVFIRKFMDEDDFSYEDDMNLEREIKLPHLTEFVAPLTLWTKDIIALNEESLKLIAIELQLDTDSMLFPKGGKPAVDYFNIDNAEEFEDLRLASLEKVIVLDGLDVDESKYNNQPEVVETEEEIFSRIQGCIFYIKFQT